MVKGNDGGGSDPLTSACPSVVRRLPSSMIAFSSSVTNSGLPAAPDTTSSSPGPGVALTTSATTSRTSPSASWRSPILRTSVCSNDSNRRCIAGGRGKGRQHAMRATGSAGAVRARAPKVTRLAGSAHCRSSRPRTRGRSSASDSTRSHSASTTRNWSPGSLLTVTGPGTRLSWAEMTFAIAARRSSAESRVQARAAAMTPNGRPCSISSAFAVATWQSRSAAVRSASVIRRVFPIPASPSITTTESRPDMARSTAERSSPISPSRPRSVGSRDVPSMRVMLRRPLLRGPFRSPTHVSRLRLPRSRARAPATDRAIP